MLCLHFYHRSVIQQLFIHCISFHNFIILASLLTFSPPTASTVQLRHWEGSPGSGLQAPSRGQPWLAVELLGALGEGRGAALPAKGGLLQDAKVGGTQHRRDGWLSQVLLELIWSFSCRVQGATVPRRYLKRSARSTSASSSPSSSSPGPSPGRRRSGPTTRWRGSSSGGVLRCHARSPRRRVRYCSRIKGSSLVSGDVTKSKSC